MSILDLSNKLDTGVLFRPPDDKLRVETFIPPLGRQSHAGWERAAARATGAVALAASLCGPGGDSGGLPGVYGMHQA